MLTQDEIAKLAREYAEDSVDKYLPDTPLVPNARIRFAEAVKTNTERLIRFLLRTHCIVSKEKATELCRLTLEHGDSVDYGLIDGLTDIVCDIFSEQYHQVAEGLDNPEIAKETEL